MMNIRDHFVDVSLYGGSDRDELIDITDALATEEEDEEDDDDEEEDDDDDDDEVDDDDGHRHDDTGDTECEEIQFTYCHSTAPSAVAEAVDNELSTAVFPRHAERCRSDRRPSIRQALCRDVHCECVCDVRTDPLPVGTCCPVLGRRHRPRPQLVRLAGRMAVLFAAAFAMLISFALYMEQLSTSDEHFRKLAARALQSREQLQQQQLGEDEELSARPAALFGLVTMPARLNGLGALLFVNGVVFYALCAASGLLCWWHQWWAREGVHLLQFPMPANRLFYVSNLAGAAGAAIFICSYQRVACHLQDPLKGFCLAFAIVFYFLFCKKVMGLQKIFAATTAVVGLLIAVDYGLCDSFRCRGVDVPPGVAATGWQSRAVWTMGYIVALAIWTLQWLLLEGDVVTTFPAQRPANASGRLLSTVSRLVAMSSVANESSHPPKCRRNGTTETSDTVWAKPPSPKRRAKPKAVLVAAWLHGMASMAALTSGLIDYVPGTPDVPAISVNEFIYDTYQTVLCHTNLCYFDGWPHHLTPTVSTAADQSLPVSMLNGSTSNDDVPQSMGKRNRRSLTNETKLHEVVINGTVHLHLETGRRRHSDADGNRKGIEMTAPDAAAHTNDTHQQQQLQQQHILARKINTEKYWKKYRNYMKRKRTSAAVEPAQRTNAQPRSSAEPDADDEAHIDDAESVSNFTLNWPIMRTGLLFSLFYAVFLLCSIQFLLDTESAVFTVAVMSLALPLAGIFWSLFELKTAEHIATIVWAPEVTGELICSVLGTPIIVLGLCLFAAAHLDDVTMRQRTYRAVAS